jgi:hypothetical protein
LTEQQKDENRGFSSQRVKCEHAHAGIKRYNAVASIYRNRVTDFDDLLMLVATGLWNFYLRCCLNWKKSGESVLQLLLISQQL